MREAPEHGLAESARDIGTRDWVRTAVLTVFSGKRGLAEIRAGYLHRFVASPIDPGLGLRRRLTKTRDFSRMRGQISRADFGEPAFRADLASPKFLGPRSGANIARGFRRGFVSPERSVADLFRPRSAENLPRRDRPASIGRAA
jgi:hypothetical protein